MWRRKKWLLVAVLAAIVLLVGVGGIALAQTPSTTPTSGKSLLARVATILGIDQQKVEDAFAQAQKEIRQEAADTYLKKQVEEGKITQEQADQYKKWWESKPDTPPGFGFRGPIGMGRFHGWAMPKLPRSK